VQIKATFLYECFFFAGFAHKTDIAAVLSFINFEALLVHKFFVAYWTWWHYNFLIIFAGDLCYSCLVITGFIGDLCNSCLVIIGFTGDLCNSCLVITGFTGDVCNSCLVIIGFTRDFNYIFLLIICRFTEGFLIKDKAENYTRTKL
jgi:hypothetical protein